MCKNCALSVDFILYFAVPTADHWVDSGADENYIIKPKDFITSKECESEQLSPERYCQTTDLFFMQLFR